MAKGLRHLQAALGLPQTGLVGEEEREALTSMLCEECGGMVAAKVNARCPACGKEVDENRFDEYRSAKKAVASLLRSQVRMANGLQSTRPPIISSQMTIDHRPLTLNNDQVKPSGAAPQFMDMLEGLFHPHNLIYVRLSDY